MLSRNDSTCKSLYDVMGVKEDASYEEIRTRYRSAILNSHPDKLQKEAEVFNSDNETEDRFLQIQRAWEILGNVKSRMLYNRELRALRQDAMTAEDVNLQDLMVENAGGSLEVCYPCQCGDCFSIDSLELGEMGYQFLRDGNKMRLQTLDVVPTSIVLPCGSCSLKVRLLITPNIQLSIDDPSID